MHLLPLVTAWAKNLGGVGGPGFISKPHAKPKTVAVGMHPIGTARGPAFLVYALHSHVPSRGRGNSRPYCLETAAPRVSFFLPREGSLFFFLRRLSSLAEGPSCMPAPS